VGAIYLSDGNKIIKPMTYTMLFVRNKEIIIINLKLKLTFIYFNIYRMVYQICWLKNFSFLNYRTQI